MHETDPHAQDEIDRWNQKIPAHSGTVKAVRSDDLLAQFGPRLTPEEVTECLSLSGEPCCQACGREWKDHHKRCEGSAN